jgi:hypothetical protein
LQNAGSLFSLAHDLEIQSPEICELVPSIHKVRFDNSAMAQFNALFGLHVSTPEKPKSSVCRAISWLVDQIHWSFRNPAGSSRSPQCPAANFEFKCIPEVLRKSSSFCPGIDIDMLAKTIKAHRINCFVITSNSRQPPWELCLNWFSGSNAQLTPKMKCPDVRRSLTGFRVGPWRAQGLLTYTRSNYLRSN